MLELQYWMHLAVPLVRIFLNCLSFEVACPVVLDSSPDCGVDCDKYRDSPYYRDNDFKATRVEHNFTFFLGDKAIIYVLSI